MYSSGMRSGREPMTWPSLISSPWRRDGDLVEVLGRPAVVLEAAFLAASFEAELLLAEGDRLVADVNAGGEGGDGEGAGGAIGEAHGGI